MYQNKEISSYDVTWHEAVSVTTLKLSIFFYNTASLTCCDFIIIFINKQHAFFFSL